MTPAKHSRPRRGRPRVSASGQRRIEAMHRSRTWPTWLVRGPRWQAVETDPGVGE